MFDWIGTFWEACSFWDKLYIVYALVVLLAIGGFIMSYVDDNPKKKLDFITEAYKDGRMAVAKMTCLTVHGNGKPQHYQAEYMYVVDGKRHFVTYKMGYSLPVDSRKEEMNADMLLMKLKTALILFYDKDNPNKAMSKLEVFASEDGIKQIDTPKKNMWRNTEKDWVEPIDLVHY